MDLGPSSSRDREASEQLLCLNIGVHSRALDVVDSQEAHGAEPSLAMRLTLIVLHDFGNT